MQVRVCYVCIASQPCLARTHETSWSPRWDMQAGHGLAPTPSCHVCRGWVLNSSPCGLHDAKNMRQDQIISSEAEPPPSVCSVEIQAKE